MKKMITPVVIFTLMVFGFVGIVGSFLPKAPAPTNVEPVPIGTPSPVSANGAVTTKSLYQSALKNITHVLRIIMPDGFKEYVKAAFDGYNFSLGDPASNNVCHEMGKCGYA